MKSENERKIQQDAVIWFNNRYCLRVHNPRWIIFSVPNEGENAYELKRKIDIGLLSGVSDLIIVGPDKVIFMECKTPAGRQSKSQIDFQKRVNDLGYSYHIFRSLQEFKEIINGEI